MAFAAPVARVPLSGSLVRVILSLAVLASCAIAGVVPTPAATASASTTSNATQPIFTQRFPILMPGVLPTTPDEYMCYGTKLPAKEIFLVEFEPLANQDVAHHMILFGCGELPTQLLKSWDCKAMFTICGSDDEKYVLYAWGRNAPPVDIPSGVGFRVGGKTRIKYLVLQVHYAQALRQSPDHSGIAVRFTRQDLPFTAGMYVLYSNSLSIPPQSVVVDTSASCTHTGGELHPMAFRVHAHELATNISCERKRNGKTDVLGWRDPSDAQAFVPVAPGVDAIRSGDVLTARCTFNSSSMDSYTFAGTDAHDEMCNCYIMFYTKNVRPCDYDPTPDAQGNIPPEPTWCLPDESGRVDGSDEGTFLCGMGRVLYTGLWEPTENKEPTECHEFPPCREGMIEYIMGNGVHCCRDYNPDSGGESAPDDADAFWNDSPRPVDAGLGFSVVPSWLQTQNLGIGQVSSTALDAHGQLLVFHRGPRVFDEKAFLPDNTLADKSPIDMDTVLVFDAKTGALVTSWGRGMFYMPHGISVDAMGTIWTVDCGAHIIRRHSASGHVLMQIGTTHVPGTSDTNFCKPTAAVVSADGRRVYITDGYCNFRVIAFSLPDGAKVAEWGELGYRQGSQLPPGGTFYVPHSIALDVRGRVYVADRQNGRVQRFGPDGAYQRSYFLQRWGLVYAVAIVGDTLYVVNGPERADRVEITALQLDLASPNMDGAVLGFFGGKPTDSTDPRWPSHPHDMVVSHDGLALFIADIEADYAFKFVKDARGAGSSWIATAVAGDSAGAGDLPTACNLRPNLTAIAPPGFDLDAFFDECPCPVTVDSSELDSCVTGRFCWADWATDYLVSVGAVDASVTFTRADGSVGPAPAFVAPRLYQDKEILWLTFDGHSSRWYLQHVPWTSALVSRIVGRTGVIHKESGTPDFPPPFLGGEVGGSASVDGEPRCIRALHPQPTNSLPSSAPSTPSQVGTETTGAAVAPTNVPAEPPTQASHPSTEASHVDAGHSSPVLSPEDLSAAGNGSSTVVAIVGGTVGGFLVLLVTAIVLLLKVRRSRRGYKRVMDSEIEMDATSSSSSSERSAEMRVADMSVDRRTSRKVKCDYQRLQAVDEEDGEDVLFEADCASE